MIKRKTIMVLGVILVFILAGVAISEKPVGKITIKITGEKDSLFDHTAHEKEVGKCARCHHKSDGKTYRKCTACHTKDGKEGVTKGKAAFHKLCIGCHKATTPKVPSGCVTCHP